MITELIKIVTSSAEKFLALAKNQAELRLGPKNNSKWHLMPKFVLEK